MAKNKRYRKSKRKPNKYHTKGRSSRQKTEPDPIEFNVPQDRYPRLVFSGNSNVGKSSITKLILSHSGMYKGKIGKAAGSTVRLNLINDRENGMHVIDLPGLGYMRHLSKAQREEVKQQIVRYFEDDHENIFLSVTVVNLLRIEDEIQKWYVERQDTIPLSFEFIQFTQSLKIPSVLVLNKVDRISPLLLERILAKIHHILADFQIEVQEPTAPYGLIGIITTSAKTRKGIEDLQEFIDLRYKISKPRFEDVLNAQEGSALEDIQNALKGETAHQNIIDIHKTKKEIEKKRK